MPNGNGDIANAPIQVVQPYYKIVKGLPAAVVRSYKQPLYDSELMLATDEAAEMVLFQKPIGQNLESWNGPWGRHLRDPAGAGRRDEGGLARRSVA